MKKKTGWKFIENLRDGIWAIYQIYNNLDLIRSGSNEMFGNYPNELSGELFINEISSIFEIWIIINSSFKRKVLKKLKLALAKLSNRVLRKIVFFLTCFGQNLIYNRTFFATNNKNAAVTEKYGVFQIFMVTVFANIGFSPKREKEK